MTNSAHQFHGDLGRLPAGSNMAGLDARMAQVWRDFTGRSEADVLGELNRVHGEMGMQLDPQGGRLLARIIAVA
jgi:hypothetical protein